jgi:hypothetical protein
MATSGSLTTSSYDGRYYKLSWKRTSYSIANNTSTIEWTLSCTGGTSWYAERTLKVVVAGKTVKDKTSRVERYAGEIDSGKITIKHNTDGTKSFSASIKAAVYTSSVNCTGSKTFTLTPIPRAATFTSAPAFTDEDNPIIKYTNAAGESVESLQACIADLTGNTIYVPYRDISKTGTEYTFNLTEAERNTLRQASANAKSIPVRFYLSTVISGATYLESIDKTLTIINAEPVISCSVVDIKPASLALTGDKNKIIKNFNEVSYSMTATPKKFASIVSTSVSSADFETSSTGASPQGTRANIQDSKMTFSATDSRGYVVSNTLTLSMIDYIPVSCSFNATMTGEGVINYDVSGNYFNGSFGAVNNSLVLQYRIKADDGEYGSWITLSGVSISGNGYSYQGVITGLDYQKTYSIQFNAIDKIHGVTTSAKKVNAFPLFDWGENDFNLNVPLHMNYNTVLRHTAENNVVMSAEGADIYLRPNGTDADEGELRLFTDGRATINGSRILTVDLIYPVGSIYMSLNETNPSAFFGGTWEQIQDRFLLAAGSTYAAGDTGGEAEHTLTVSEIPSHNHTVYARSVYSGTGSYIALCNKDNSSTSYVTSDKGGGKAHNNMPPYLAVYMWQRTA